MNSNVDLVQNHTNFKAVQHAVYNDVAQYIFLICWEDITQIYSVTNGLTLQKDTDYFFFALPANRRNKGATGNCINHTNICDLIANYVRHTLFL